MARITAPLPDERTAFDELTTIIEDLHRFALVFMLCASEADAMEHIDNYQYFHPDIPIVSYRVDWPDGRLATRLAGLYEEKKPRAIFVFGMSAWTEFNDKAKGNDFTIGLNQSRDYMNDHVLCPVVFWCSPMVFTHIMRNAQDFFSVATATLRVSLPTQVQSQVVDLTKETRLDNLESLGPSERQERIYELKIVADEKLQSSDGSFERLPILLALGRLLYADARYIEARIYAREALNISENILPGSIEHAKSLSLLAHIESVIGNLSEAELLYRQALQIEERMLGLHPMTAATTHNIGYIKLREGMYNEAEYFFRRALEIKQATLGQENPETLATMIALGQVAFELGDYPTSLEINEQVLRSQEAANASSSSRALTLNNLGKLYQETHRFSDAKAAYEQALKIEEETLGEHPETANTLTNMAMLAFYMRDLQEAKALLDRARYILEKTLGNDHSRTVNTQTLMSTLDNLATKLQERVEREDKDHLGADAIKPIRYPHDRSFLAHRPSIKRKKK